MRTRTGLPALLAAASLAGLLAACSGESSSQLIASGKAYLDKQDARAAVIQFKSALQKQPQSGEARYLLGQALLASGDAAGAALELGKALDLKHDEKTTVPLLARALLQSGDFRKLTATLGSRTLADRPAQAALQTTLAAAWLRQGDAARAGSAIDTALAAVPNHVPAIVQRARLEAMAGRTDAALALLAPALAREGRDAEGWQLQGEVLEHAKGDRAGALQAWRRALEADPAFVPAHLSLVTAALQADDLAAAKEQAAKLRAALPRHPQTLYVDARLALASKDLKTAREATQQLLRMAPDSPGVLQLAGMVELQGGSALVAANHFGRALQAEPGNAFVRRMLARAYLRLGQPAKAVPVLEPLSGRASADAEALALAGQAQLQLGDAPAAEALFVRATRAAPTDPRPRTTLALLKLDRGEVDAGFAQLEAIAAESTDAAADLAIVSARLKRREYDAALRALDAMARKQPDSATVQELRGRVFAARHDGAAARRAFERALQIEPARYSATAALAALDVSEGRREQAAERLQAAMRSDPRNHAARLALAELRAAEGRPLAELRALVAEGISAAPGEAAPRLRLVELLLTHKQVKEALAAAQEAAAALPNDAEVQDALGRCQELAGDTQQAISTFRKLAATENRSARPHVRLADLLKAGGNREGAIASLERALEIEPNLEAAQTRLADLLIVDGRPKAAIEMARALQQRAPASPVGWLLEGAIQRRVKAPEAAIEAYRNGLARAADSAPLALEFDRALRAAGRGPEADRFAEGWVKRHPDDTGFDVHLAGAAIVRRDLDRAETLLQKVLAREPNHVLALNNLAWVMVQRNRPGAAALAQKAVELQPNQPALMDTLATALAAEQQPARALELQRRVVDLAPGEMGLRLNLARIALQAGDRGLARSELDRLAALGPKLPQQPEVQRLLKLL